MRFLIVPSSIPNLAPIFLYDNPSRLSRLALSVPEGGTFPFQVTGCAGTLPGPPRKPFIAHRIAGLR